MHPLEKKTETILSRNDLIPPGSHVLAAVSAGPDSMALLQVLASLAGPGSFSLSAAYLNHGLRPTETDREEALVRNWAHRQGLSCTIGGETVAEHARRQGLSLEHAARELRYRFLDKTAARVGAQTIALAHTADDQAEELLLRLIRGTGRAGLAGMKALRAGRYIRPFLTIAKEELLRYLHDRQVPFLEDSSNQDRSLVRNRVRLELLPFLAQHFNPAIRQTLLQTTTILQDEEDLLAGLTTEAAEQVFLLQPGKQKGGTPLSLDLDLDRFREQPPAIRRRLLEMACWRMGQRPTFRIIEQLLEMGRGTTHPASLHLGNGLRVEKGGGTLRLHYPLGPGPWRGELAPERAGEPSWQISIPGPGIYPVPPLGRALVLDSPVVPHPEIFNGQARGDFLDFERITFPMTLRPPCAGDRFHPLGGPGRQKINDYLGNRKIRQDERKQVAVLLSQETVIALPGLQIDHRFRVSDKTRTLLRLRWHPLEEGGGSYPLIEYPPSTTTVCP